MDIQETYGMTESYGTSKARFWATLKAIWTGTESRPIYFKYFFTVFGVYLLGIFIGAALYPGGFSFFHVYVSYLGAPLEDPVGSWFYNTIIFFVGILLIPNFVFLYRRLAPTAKALSFIACLFGMVGSAGLTVLSILHQGVGANKHEFATYLTYFGFGVAAIFMLLVFIRKAWLKDAWPKSVHIVIIYGLVIGLMILATFIPIPIYVNGIPLDDHFWEWIYTLAEGIWVVGVPLATPKES